MIEVLALPAWDTGPIPLSAWTEQLDRQGLEVVVTRDTTDATWIEVHSLWVRGYVLMDGLQVEAIHFELEEPDPGPARAALDQAAVALAWELHDDDGDGDDDDVSNLDSPSALGHGSEPTTTENQE